MDTTILGFRGLEFVARGLGGLGLGSGLRGLQSFGVECQVSGINA